MYTRAKRKRSSERTDEENENTQKKENGGKFQFELFNFHLLSFISLHALNLLCSATDYSEDEEVEENEEGHNEADDDDDDNEDDGEDEEGDNQKRYDFRQRKAVVRYQVPQDGSCKACIACICHFINVLLIINTQNVELNNEERSTS